jgi:hypothetical protein
MFGDLDGDGKIILIRRSPRLWIKWWITGIRKIIHLRFNNTSTFWIKENVEKLYILRATRYRPPNK